ncbi:MAG: hypothetical protein K8F25_16080, partial [Fimbriimonadaceae bacterium]|nr:hypothetical protein [Alphaproteobacteria bacterium]
LNDYRRLVLDERRRSNRDKTKGAENKKASRKDQQAQRQASAEHRATLNPLRKEIKAAETRIEKLERRLVELDDALSAPDLFQKDPAKGAELGSVRAETQRTLQEVLEHWLKLSSDLEEARAAGTEA